MKTRRQPYDPVTNPLIPIVTNGNTTGGSNLGGRIVRITPQGVVNTFAQGFNTSGNLDASPSSIRSCRITFSADGTTLYASDDDGIWQFKTMASLAGSTSGSLIGLNDLRTLGVPYDGQNSAVAVVDTGVDANSAPFRGRVAPGKNLCTGGLGNNDFAASGGGTTTANGGGGAGGGTGGTGGTGTTGANPVQYLRRPRHAVAGVVAQFVPQATIDPVTSSPRSSHRSRYRSATTGGGGGAGGGGRRRAGGGGGGGTTGTGTISQVSNALTTAQTRLPGHSVRRQAPVRQRPGPSRQVRPRDRLDVSPSGRPETFATEAQAFKSYPQIVIALKNQLHRFRKLGIAPIAAAGQFGAPLGAGSATAAPRVAAGRRRWRRRRAAVAAAERAAVRRRRRRRRHRDRRRASCAASTTPTTPRRRRQRHVAAGGPERGRSRSPGPIRSRFRPSPRRPRTTRRSASSRTRSGPSWSSATR